MNQENFIEFKFYSVKSIFLFLNNKKYKITNTILQSMKHLYTALVIFFIAFKLSAQCPTGDVILYSQAQVNAFINLYPNCTQINGSLVLLPSAGGNISNLNGLQNITRINGSFRVDQNNSAITSIAGMNNLNYIGGDIYINDTWIETISSFQNVTYVGGSVEILSNSIRDFSPLNNITHIGGSLKLGNDSNYCALSGLMLGVTTVPGDVFIGEIGFNDNNFDSFSSLVSVGGDFEIGANNLTNLTNLGALQSVGGILSFSSCPNLTSLNGLNSLTSIGGLIVNAGCNNLSSIAGLNNITSLNLGFLVNGTNLTSLAGLENITSFGGYFGITSNSNLTSINSLSNANLSAVTSLNIYENTNLALCQELNVCNYLFTAATDSYLIGNNAVGCSNYDDLIESCNLRWKNLIRGTVKIDFENNGCDTGTDFPMNNAHVRAISGTATYATFADANGNYRLFVPPGNYNLLTNAASFNYTSTPINYSVSFPTIGNEEVKNFCNAPSQVTNDVKILFYPLTVARPGFDIVYCIKYENIGTTPLSGSLSFTFDVAKMSFISSTVPANSQSGGTLTWNYSDLYPFQHRYINVTFNVLPPPIINLGDTLPLSASILPVSGDFTPVNNSYSMNQMVVNSYDPNDKTALEGNTILVQNLGKHLHYLVRFQNTGSASALNIRVTDTLDAKLDPNTFELADLSHPGRVQLKNNVVEFQFDNINLPDSTSDEPNSHGYVVFRIKPKSTTVFGNTIQNTANIYFDYNAPIITNTVQTFVDADTDSDGVYDSVDNCKTVANPDQLDTDNDGFGDVCDDNLEVSPPYFMGFDTATLDPFWKTYRQTSSTATTSVTVSNLNDVNGNGNTIKLYSYASLYTTMLISPRLNNLTTSSIVKFWASQEGSTTYDVEVGFMTNPLQPTSFRVMQYINPTSTMREYVVNMANYNPAYGKNLAIKVKGRTIYIDDFNYTNTALSLDENLKSDFVVYPNPVNELLNIHTLKDIDVVAIYDINGRSLDTLTPQITADGFQIDVKNLSNGLYFVVLKSGKETHRQKFMKN